MKPFQPDHPELLINTEWGLDAAAIDKSAAKERGLVQWKRRWVTTDEKKRLKREHHAYRGIRGTGILAIVGGFLSLAQLPGPMDPIARLYLFLVASVMLTSGVQILRYRGWARWTLLAAVAVDLALMVPAALAGDIPIGLPGIRLLILGLYASYLFSRNARAVFGPPVAGSRGSTPSVTTMIP